MRRLALTSLLWLTLAGCVLSPAATSTPLAVPSKSATEAGARQKQVDVTPTATPGQIPLPTEPVLTPASDFRVEFHPDGALYTGDKVSLEVLAPAGFDPSGRSVAVSADGNDLGSAPIGSYGIAGRQEALFTWAWDTTALEPGAHQLDFSVAPAGPNWSETVTLLPAADLPPPGASAHWETVTTVCCEISYITGTDAERDIATLEQMADAQAEDVEQKLGATLPRKIQVVIMSRVLGHSGFTNDAIYVSYLDRNYAGRATAQVLHHEMVHWFDGEESGDLRPTILVEGLAVYLSGGHFKPESLAPRAASLLDLGWYIPLRRLTDDFYPSQHEIGYIEAGALVQYLVESYDQEAFDSFYRDIHPAPSGQQSDAIDSALQKHFHIGFEQLEANWLDWLRRLPEDPAAGQDVVDTVRFYETVRRYQVLFDPSAYFQTAWLPDEKEMIQRGIVADYLRHPDAPINKYLETLLVQADAGLRAGNYGLAGHLLGAVNALMGVVQGLN
jgi:hypothetical protein